MAGPEDIHAVGEAGFLDSSEECEKIDESSDVGQYVGASGYGLFRLLLRDFWNGAADVKVNP